MEPRPHADETFRGFIAVPLGESVRRLAQERVRVLRERSFRPHLTLGRAKRSRRAPAFPDFFLDKAQRASLEVSQGVSFEVTESVLFQSELLRSGARYTALERFPLEGEAGT